MVFFLSKNNSLEFCRKHEYPVNNANECYYMGMQVGSKSKKALMSQCVRPY